MIDTKFRNTDPTTSLDRLREEVVKEDKFRTIEIAGLRDKIKTLEDARQVQIRLNREFREAIGKNVKLTTPEKKTLWERITGK